VQEEEIQYLPGHPLPTEFWSRPIEGENTEWASIASNYLEPFGAAYQPGVSRFQPDGTGPNSPHIMWTNPINFGGVVGGSDTGVTGATFYTGLSYESRFGNPIIIYGRLYYALPRGGSGSGGGYVCVDLQTGKELWRQSYTANPSFGQLEWFDSPNQHGVVPNGYLWATSGSTWIAYDALDGNWLFNVTNVPSGTRARGPNGELIIYQLNVAGKWLALWNITQVISNGVLNGLQMNGYRPVGQVFNTTLRQSYSWNVTIPTLPSDAAIRAVIRDDIMIGSAGVRSVFGQASFGGVASDAAASKATFWTLSLKPTSLGQLVWMKDYQAPAGNVTRQFGPVDPDARVFFMSDKETMQWSGYDLDTGSLLWGPLGKTRDFNYYPTIGSGGVSQVGFAAYSKLYTGGYGGEFFCYDSKTGNLLWKYNNTNSGLETPWGLYPVFPGGIVDGKVYIYSGEHSPNSPSYKGSRVRCLNATTGEEMWTLLSWAAVGGFADQGFAIADGTIAYLNVYDMQVYAIGKGPSQTTIEAPMTASTLGSSIVIRGTVTDISAGTKQKEQAARFPNGVPAVSDESQAEWMAYVYMQKSRPMVTTGVELKLMVLDSNNNYRDIGITRTDSNGFFSFQWKPDISGKYTVYAIFPGSESYWPSTAVTAFAVDEAPLPVESPEYPQPIDNTMTIVGVGVAILIAVAIVGAVIVLMLRKRP
jgi:outer membrane protein assembly factor BamB